MRRGLIAACALSATLCAAPAAVAALHPGDIIVGSMDYTLIDNFPLFAGKVRVFTPDGSLLQELYSGNGYTSDLKFSPSGTLYGAAGAVVFRFANDGSMLTPLSAPPYAMNSLAFTRSGYLFATDGGGAVVKFGSDGSQQGLIRLGTDSSVWADLGMDECTLYFWDSMQIGRFNLCSNTMMTPLLAQVGDFGRTLLVLSDGSLLVSTSHAIMYRIRQDGTVLRQYATHALAYSRDLSPDFVWVSNSTGFAKFDLQNDAIVAGPFSSGPGDVMGIAVVGADFQTIPVTGRRRAAKVN